MTGSSAAGPHHGVAQAGPASALVAALADHRLTMATAESLTGGLLSDAIVALPGSSAVMRGGVVSYATDTKAKVLGVDADLLDRMGPVQAEVAIAMARGVSALMGANLGLATTGVAGPGWPADQQGLFYVASWLSSSHGSPVSRVRRYWVAGSRQMVRRCAVDQACVLGWETTREQNQLTSR